jgi:hypothetical protein
MFLLVLHYLKKYLFTDNVFQINRRIFIIHHLDVIRSERVVFSHESTRDWLDGLRCYEIHLMSISFVTDSRLKLRDKKLDTFIDRDESDLEAKIREKLNIFIISIIHGTIKCEFLVISSIA